VFRSDPGWKAESDGIYDFRYHIRGEGVGPFDFRSRMSFTCSPSRAYRACVKCGFRGCRSVHFVVAQNDPGLPVELRTSPFADWKKLFNNLTSAADPMSGGACEICRLDRAVKHLTR